MSVPVPLKHLYEEYDLMLFEKIGNKDLDSRAFALAAFPPFVKVLLEFSSDRKKTAEAIKRMYADWFLDLEKELGDVHLSSEHEKEAEEIAKRALCKLAEAIIAPLISANEDLDEKERMRLYLNMAFNAVQLGTALASGHVVYLSLEKLRNICWKKESGKNQKTGKKR